MPIRPEMVNQYPPEWKAISRACKERAEWRCEWCGAEHGKPHHETGSKVVLTTAHLNHRPFDCRPENLRALCQKCHLAHDAAMHKRMRARNLARKAGRGSGVLEL